MLSRTEQKNSTFTFLVKATKGLTALTPVKDCDWISSNTVHKHINMIAENMFDEQCSMFMIRACESCFNLDAP
jgi:hypothetical protein